MSDTTITNSIPALIALCRRIMDGAACVDTCPIEWHNEMKALLALLQTESTQPTPAGPQSKMNPNPKCSTCNELQEKLKLAHGRAILISRYVVNDPTIRAWCDDILQATEFLKGE